MSNPGPENNKSPYRRSMCSLLISTSCTHIRPKNKVNRLGCKSNDVCLLTSCLDVEMFTDV
jgi:hypothetical protein